MIKKKVINFILLSIFFLISFNNTFANNIATINIEFILSQSYQYSDFLKNLMSIKKEAEDNFQIKEKELNKQNNEIENSQLILNDIEIQTLINEYNINISEFQNEINEFNNYINNKIEINKNIMIKIIAEITTDLSIANDFQIVLSENNYFLASDNIDISKKVIDELNKRQIELERIN